MMALLCDACLRLRVHIRVGIIAPVRADTCGDYVHTSVGMIAPMCAYTCGHDHAHVYIARWLVGMRMPRTK